ncbi:hypothetical protein WA158_001327 [Blastocystis sp. Blastoise]
MSFCIEFVFTFVMSIPVMGPTAAYVLKESFSGHYEKARLAAFGAALAEGIYASIGFILYFNFFQDPLLLNKILPYLKIIGSLIVMTVGKNFIYMDTSSFSSSLIIYYRESRLSMVKEGFYMAIVNISLVANHLGLLAILGPKSLLSFSYLNLPFWFLGTVCGMTCWFLIFVTLLETFKQKIKLSSFVSFMNYLGFLLLCIGAFTFLNSIWSMF